MLNIINTKTNKKQPPIWTIINRATCTLSSAILIPNRLKKQLFMKKICYVRYIVCYWGEFMIRTHNKLTYWNARFGMSGFSRKSATVLSDCIGIRYLSIRWTIPLLAGIPGVTIVAPFTASTWWKHIATHYYVI